MSKLQLSDLAIFGGKAAFDAELHVGRPNVPDRRRLLERMSDILDRKWLTNNGPYVQEFEQRVAEMIGVKHCIAMCNGTAALEVAIKAADLRDEVIVPSFTFVGTVHALQWQQLKPVFCDVDPLSHNIDPARVEQMITPRTTGIMGVHVWGRPCDIPALTKISKKYNLRLLFDAAHAFGCSHRGRMIGNFGDAEAFSFHATKFFNTFEGGAVVTNNEDLAAKIRLMKNFGFAGNDEVIQIGINGKMSEPSAAMGLSGLENLDEFIKVNRINYQQYRNELEGLQGVRLLTFDESEKCNFQYVVFEVDESVTQVSRDEMLRVLWSENVLARRYFYPGCHRMEPYRSLFPNAGLMLPETERVVERVLCLPTGTSIGSHEIRTICDIIRVVLLNGDVVRKRLRDLQQMMDSKDRKKMH